MIVFESRLVRRFVGRLERGEEVLATLRQLCEQERIRAAWIRAAGILEWVDLVEWDPEREAWRAPRRIEGPITCVGIEGTAAIRGGPTSIELHASLARASDLGVTGFGGTVSSARAYALDFAIEVFEDVRLERDEDTATGLALFKGPSVRGVIARDGAARAGSPAHGASPAARVDLPTIQRASAGRSAEPPAPDDRDDGDGEGEPRTEGEPTSVRGGGALSGSAVSPSALSTGAVSWAQAAAISAQAAAIPAREREEPRFLSEPMPQKGDWIDHRQFGLCRVDGEDEEGGLRIRLPSGVRKVIKLEFLEVMPPRHEGDRRIFPLRPRKR
jgi:predicted DNA-binding protein with PD1-like motif